MVINTDDSKPIAGLNDQLDWQLRALRRPDRIFEHIGTVGGTIDCENLRALSELGLEGRTVPNDL